jgi:hypothetical protein
LFAIGKHPETSINSSIDTLPNRFPSIDSAKKYSLRYVKNSAVESFTNLRMQNVVYGTLQLLDSLCGAGVIDTIWKSGDTLKYRIGTQTVIVGVFGGSGSTPTLQQVTNQGNSTTDEILVTNNGQPAINLRPGPFGLNFISIIDTETYDSLTIRPNYIAFTKF